MLTELKAKIDAAKRDIEYCKNEIINLQENAKEYPINAGYAAKEIRKTEDIIKSHEDRLRRYESELPKLYTGKKYYTCRRCAGQGTHSGGRCYGCSGAGTKKTKAYKTFLGEPTDDLPY